MTLPHPIDMRHALVVEDNAVERRRFTRLLVELIGEDARIDVVQDLGQAKALIAQDAPTFVLSDIGLPDGSGIDLISDVHIQHPATACVAVSAWGHEDTVLTALQAGAVGYLMKEREDAELRLALQSIRRGGALMDPLIARRILDLFTPAFARGSECGSNQGSTQGQKQRPKQNQERSPKHDQNDEPRQVTPASELPAIVSAARPLPLDASPVDPLTRRETEILSWVAHGDSNREIADRLNLSRYTIEDHTKNIYRKLMVGSRTAAVSIARSKGLLR